MAWPTTFTANIPRLLAVKLLQLLVVQLVLIASPVQDSLFSLPSQVAPARPLSPWDVWPRSRPLCVRYDGQALPYLATGLSQPEIPPYQVVLHATPTALVRMACACTMAAWPTQEGAH